jgi:hypothetical protein
VAAGAGAPGRRRLGRRPRGPPLQPSLLLLPAQLLGANPEQGQGGCSREHKHPDVAAQVAGAAVVATVAAVAATATRVAAVI